jgi:hypothetical protein
MPDKKENYPRPDDEPKAENTEEKVEAKVETLND